MSDSFYGRESEPAPCKYSLAQCISGVLTSKKEVVEEIARSLPLKLAVWSYGVFTALLFVLSIIGNYIQYRAYAFASPALLNALKDLDVENNPILAYSLVRKIGFWGQFPLGSIAVSLLVVLGIWLGYCALSYLFAKMLGGHAGFAEHFIVFGFIYPFIVWFGVVCVIGMLYFTHAAFSVFLVAILLALIGIIWWLVILIRCVGATHKIGGARSFFAVILSGILFIVVCWIIFNAAVSAVLMI